MTTQLNFSVREDTDDFAHSGCSLSTPTSALISARSPEIRPKKRSLTS